MKTQMNKQNYTVYEYEKLYVNDPLSKSDFEALRLFVLKQESEGSVNACVPFENLKTDEVGACMKLGAKDGKEYLAVQNYVGTILLSTGTTIEILPKVGKLQEDRARDLVVEMLKVCGLIGHKSFQNANIDTKKMKIFEVYIRVFLNEVFKLYK